jgi:hypothetical protein
MMNFMTNFKSNRQWLTAALALAVLIGCAGTFARAADDDDNVMLDTKIFRGILKELGLRRDGDTIDYRERSPLVLPPGTDLPPPETNSAAKKAADWPDDADLKRVRKRKEAERNRKPFEEGIDDRPLLPSQMGGPKVGSRAGEAPGRSAEQAAAPSTNKELGSKGFSAMLGGLWAPKEEYVPFTGEPPRASLTEPPRGYRTPSPAQPYGVGKDKWTPAVVDKQEIVR